MTPRHRIREAWNDAERGIVERAAAGMMTVAQMVDALPHRTIKTIRQRFAAQGNPDEDTRHRRACEVASYGLQVATNRLREKMAREGGHVAAAA